MNLTNLDLDLLLVLHTVLEEQSATRAAERLNLSRPAVSNAIARLRASLGDPLFVRTSRGFLPTPLALQMAPHLAVAIKHLRAAVETATGFQPRTTSRRFTLACSDYEQLAFLPRVIADFRRRMPHAALRVLSVEQMLQTNALMSGDVDLFLGVLPTPRPFTLAAQVIAHDDIVCIARRDHPRIPRQLSAALFFELPHVELALLGQRPSSGRQLAEAAEAEWHQKRRIALSVPNFISVAISVAASDCLAAIPRRLATLFAQSWPLRILPLPLRFPPLATEMVWHLRSSEDAPVQYLRTRIAAVTKDRARPRHAASPSS